MFDLKEIVLRENSGIKLISIGKLDLDEKYMKAFRNFRDRYLESLEKGEEYRRNATGRIK